MPNSRTPGCVWDPGLNAGYRRGRNDMRLVKVHKTAGNNSYGVCKTGGLCQWLVPTEGPPWQFAEADAVCFDSGPYNGWGPGIEIEAPVTGGLIRPGLSEFRDLTANQIAWTGKIIRWLHTEWGVPLALYDGPRFRGEGFVGFENHGDLDNQRTDGVTREEWDAMTFALPPLPPLEEDDMKLIVSESHPEWGIFVQHGMTRRHVDKPERVAELVAKGIVSNSVPVKLNDWGFMFLEDLDA